jgi:hypothetical protein
MDSAIQVAVGCGVRLAHPTNSHNFLSPIPTLMCGIGEVGAIDGGCSGLRPRYTNYAMPGHISSNSSSKLGPLLHLRTLLSFPSLAACRNSHAMASSSSLPPWHAKFFHLTRPQQKPPCSLLTQSHEYGLRHSAPCTDTACCCHC